MANTIVTVNVSQTIAPTPSTLQQTGAFISQGGTTLAAGSYSLLTSASSLTSLLGSAKTNASLTWASSVVTATTTAAHGLTTADTLWLTIAGAAPAGYNGTFLCTVTGANTFTYALASNPGSETLPGTWVPGSVAELSTMNTSFFAQGSSQGVYVLELGAVGTAAGVTALTSFINTNPGTFYSYLVPREWDNAASFLTLLASFESTSAKTYFFITSTISTYTNYTALQKCAFVLVEAPAVVAAPTTEFSCAAPFFVTLNYSPSSTNKVTPTAFSYVYGVTPYPTKVNGTLLASLKTAGVNVIGTGAEGGITNTILLWGTTMDGNDFTYWYSVDWMQINIDQNISNAIINGSNNPINPLYYNQDGINRLQQVAVATVASGVEYGLVLFPPKAVTLTASQLTTSLDTGTIGNYAPSGQSYGATGTNANLGYSLVNAIPFIPYSIANPSDFKIGKYAGLSTIYTPNRGFLNIVFNINVSQFVAA